MYSKTDSGGLTMRQWRHEPPAASFWAKKAAPHSDLFQIFEVINLYNRSVWPSTKVVGATRIGVTWHCDLKHTHFQTTFSMPEFAIIYLQQCRNSKFFRGRTPDPPLSGGEPPDSPERGTGEEGERRAERGRKGRREGRGRNGRRRPLASGPSKA